MFGYKFYPNPENLTPSRMVWMVTFFKSESKTQQSSKTYWEAQFGGCFSQVQQVKLVNIKLEDQPVVFIDTHNKLQKV